ncbi:MAG TPA: DNA polymerase III subunit delta [Anaerovoracaceae bacterium]|nr:DNA polymerase III subunit delta [Anaerovoracaceae bacterium]
MLSKTELGFRDFNRIVTKKQLNKVVLLMGSESFLINWAINNIVNRYINDEYKALDLTKLDGDVTSVEDIIMNSDTYSMFSDKRVVLIRNYSPLYQKNVKGFGDKEEEKLINYLKGYDSNSIIVFYLDGEKQQELNSLGKKVKKISQCFEFVKLDIKELRGFIKKRFDNNKLVYENKLIDYVINVSGYMNKDSSYKLIDLNSDIEKITVLTEGNTLSERDINLAVLGTEDTYIFNLIDSMCNRDIKKAMNITINKLNNNESAFQIIGLVIAQFEIIYDIKSMEEIDMTPYQIEKELKINRYRFDKAYKASKNFNLNELKQALVRVYNIDKMIKTGQISEDLALPVFISELK